MIVRRWVRAAPLLMLVIVVGCGGNTGQPRPTDTPTPTAATLSGRWDFMSVAESGHPALPITRVRETGASLPYPGIRFGPRDLVLINDSVNAVDARFAIGRDGLVRFRDGAFGMVLGARQDQSRIQTQAAVGEIVEHGPVSITVEGDRMVLRSAHYELTASRVTP